MAQDGDTALDNTRLTRGDDATVSQTSRVFIADTEYGENTVKPAIINYVIYTPSTLLSTLLSRRADAVNGSFHRCSRHHSHTILVSRNQSITSSRHLRYN
jgi:hypothetical protein